MMSILRDWYLGERVLEFVLIVTVGVALLSGVAWVVSWRLARQPASRHLVLVSALIGCLAMPVLAAALSACGCAIISIPILPVVSSPLDSGITRLGPQRGSTVDPAARDPLRTATAGLGEPVGLSRSRGTTTPGDVPRVPTSGLASIVTATPPHSALLPQHTSQDARWPVPLREIATLAQIFWGCGSLLLIMRFAWGCLLVHWLGRSSRLLVEPSVCQLRDDISLALDIRSAPRILLSRRVTTPVAVGLLRPIVVLPERLIGEISAEQMRDVLLHELAHVSRRDSFFVLVQELVRTLYWPIPPVHGLIRELGRAREELCDNYVLQTRDAVSYGETLLYLAELSLDARPLGAAVGILHWRGELERRIAGFLEEGRSTMTRSNRWLVCIVALLFLVGGAVASATRFTAGREINRGEPTPVQVAQKVRPEAAANGQPAQQPQEKRTMLVHVLGPDGQPMAGVKLHRGVWTRKPIANRNMRYVSDENGEARVDLPDGIYIFRLWARAKGYVPLFAHWEEEDVPERSLPAEFTFRLQQGSVIGGIVRNSDGQAIKGVSVDVMLNRGGHVEGRTGPDMWLSEGEEPITDAEGRWTLDNIPPSLNLELRLKFSHADYISDREWGEMQDQQGVDLKALRSRQAAIILRGGLVATGTVTDSHGKPVAGAVVVRGDSPYREEGSQEVRTDESGRYQFPPLPSGSLTITVMAQGWMPALRKVEIRQGMSPFDFRLEPGKELRIRFVDGAGKPVPGVGVMIDKWRGGESLYNHRHPNVLNTQIPVQADENGLYRWTWAPGDSVTYVFEKEGFVRHEVSLTPRDSEQTVTLPQILKISGKVTEAATGQTVGRFIAIPVVEFRPGFLMVDRTRAQDFSDGIYELKADRTDVSYRVRVEAEGYRSAMSDVVRAGSLAAAVDFRLDAAPSLTGRILDRRGQPVKDARVYLATPSQGLNDWPDDHNTLTGSFKVLTDDEGRFSLPAQFERSTIVAVHDSGYAEVTLKPNQQPGELALKDWAHVEGRLLQAGQPVAGAWINFHPVRLLNGVSPHIQDQMSVKTDRGGRFVFQRVPPVKASVRAQLSVWQNSPLTSSQSVPLDLQPGEHAVLDLGGKGTTVKGRVLLSGDAASKIDLHKSLNWLLRRAPGIEPPAEVRALGLTARNGWNHAWTATQEGMALIESQHNYFVVLDKDGRFSVQGVPAGDYDLALRLYEPPGDGCLVSPVGARIIRFQVNENAAHGAGVDLGDIAVNVALGPRVGDVVPDFAFADLAGKTTKLSALRGRYVLIDFWATWCAPCVTNLPALAKLHDRFGREDRLTVLGVNLDDDPDQARKFVAREKLSWTQAFLGRAQDKNGILSRYAINFLPTHLLIGPDGKLIERNENLQVITEASLRVLHGNSGQ